eukprot:Plantae.Rhodophyta-Rhodochaete_pulchella.ctg15681.p1 GENE.Plantae.Rhodophyta-Rhodochaete_pulchella.ctg15681~~Plantae.Rhodophyta-Rhodochaete_pulchella.ctg15681.p1  ORF type:complete len:468 (-),score=65.43 Plantae.Rhodophyta-Rhodochaete_pulchella.ctg15681:494-1843(-)
MGFVFGLGVNHSAVTLRGGRATDERRKAVASRRKRRSTVVCCENAVHKSTTQFVEKLYDAYPFPPDPMIDEPPIGYNWRWHFPSAYAFCTGAAPTDEQLKDLAILDAGCGTGCGTEYLVYLNPTASVTGVDLSSAALDVARERVSRSLPADALSRVNFEHMSLFDLDEKLPEGQMFDLINCVGVIHHTPDPLRATKELTKRLKPGGILHIFVYALHGRWEIQLMQKAIALMQRGRKDYTDGVRIGRALFSTLPEDNRLRKREESRWAQENQRDATFADMYVHPQEIDYDVPSIFELIDNSGLEFLGFSNPRTYDLSRILGSNPELLELAEDLPLRERLRLVELLDPESVTHFEFFLGKSPVVRESWTDLDRLRHATAVVSPCIHGWPTPSRVIFDRDYVPVQLEDDEHAFMSALAEHASVGDAMDKSSSAAETVRGLVAKSLILLTPHG